MLLMQISYAADIGSLTVVFELRRTMFQSVSSTCVVLSDICGTV